MSDEPSATDSRFGPVVDALRRFRSKESKTLSPAQLATTKEIETRLRRLAGQYEELLQVNQRLMDTDSRRPQLRFDPSSDTLTAGVGDTAIQIRFNRADPNVPISVDTLSATGIYTPGETPNESDELTQLKSRMESLLEDFYHSAHRVIKLVNTLPGMRKVEARAITIVRNKLVAHPEIGDFYSFGWSTSGPVVRPIHRPGRQWVDAGLIPNTKELTEVLSRAFR